MIRSWIISASGCRSCSSAAITAGVAPLLFLQILYQREFYTANLLLFNRWMAILPVLIVGFYSLYLIKGDWLWQQRWPLRAVVCRRHSRLLRVHRLVVDREPSAQRRRARRSGPSNTRPIASAICHQ